MLFLVIFPPGLMRINTCTNTCHFNIQCNSIAPNSHILYFYFFLHTQLQKVRADTSTPTFHAHMCPSVSCLSPSASNDVFSCLYLSVWENCAANYSWKKGQNHAQHESSGTFPPPPSSSTLHYPPCRPSPPSNITPALSDAQTSQ